MAVVLDGELESVNCSAGSVCLWCEWNANWVVVRCAGGTARRTACGLEVNASSMTALRGGWQFDAQVTSVLGRFGRNLWPQIIAHPGKPGRPIEIERGD